MTALMIMNAASGLAAVAAANGPGPVVLDLGSGAAAQLAGETLALAKGLFVPMLLLSLVIDGFFRLNSGPSPMPAVLFRAAVILMLLSYYGQIMGGAVKFAEDLAAKLAPPDVRARFGDAVEKWKSNHDQNAAIYEKSKTALDKAGLYSLGDPIDRAIAGSAADAFGGVVFDSAVTLLLLVGQAAHVIMGYLSRILAALFYVLGPLALVFAVPRASDVGARWFRMFATFLAWPIISGLLLTLTVSVGEQGLFVDNASAYSAVATAMLLLATAIACPFLASALVGGSLKNIAEHGFDIALMRAAMVQRWAKNFPLEFGALNGRSESKAGRGGNGSDAARGNGRGGAPHPIVNWGPVKQGPGNQIPPVKKSEPKGQS